MKSRRLDQMCCATQLALLNLCLSDMDLAHLGPEGPLRTVSDDSVRKRVHLLRTCRHDPACRGRVADLLDLRHLDALGEVRGTDLEELEPVVERHLGTPSREAFAALLWSLCTDPRPPVHALGTRLCLETLSLGCRALTRPTSAPHPNHETL